MARYTKQTTTGGAFIDKKTLVNGVKAKLVSECLPVERDFEGKPQTQHIAKMRVQGDEESKNVSLNLATRNGLIDAFGEDSKDWINKILTIYTEKTSIGGKRVTILYLLPEGFEVTEDEGGYIVIKKKGSKTESPIDTVEYHSEDINPDDIPL